MYVKTDFFRGHQITLKVVVFFTICFTDSIINVRLVSNHTVVRFKVQVLIRVSFLSVDFCYKRPISVARNQHVQKGIILILIHFFYRHSIDATTHVDRLGRFADDAPSKLANSVVKKICCLDRPRLCLFALKNIDSGEEVVYDYGDKPENLCWR